ncbi:MAG: hypothetical protein ABIO21_10320 [Pseudomonas sp.]
MASPLTDEKLAGQLAAIHGESAAAEQLYANNFRSFGLKPET